MPYLTAAVVLIGLLCVCNLLLTLGLIRRLKRQDSHHDVSAALPIALRPGSRVGEFTAVTIDGEPVSHETISGLVGFFSAGCSPCHRLIPDFVRHARAVGRDNALAVVSGSDPTAVETLAPVTRVIVEDYDGPVENAFENTWTPAVYLIDAEHRVVAAGGSLEDLPLGSPK